MLEIISFCGSEPSIGSRIIKMIGEGPAHVCVVVNDGGAQILIAVDDKVFF